MINLDEIILGWLIAIFGAVVEDKPMRYLGTFMVVITSIRALFILLTN